MAQFRMLYPHDRPTRKEMSSSGVEPLFVEISVGFRRVLAADHVRFAFIPDPETDLPSQLRRLATEISEKAEDIAASLERSYSLRE